MIALYLIVSNVFLRSWCARVLVGSDYTKQIFVYRYLVMERENTPSFTSRVSLDPRLSTQIMRSHHNELLREITPLMVEQQTHLQRALDLQTIIQDRLEAYASMQSPCLPKRLRNSCDTPSPKVSVKPPTISELEVEIAQLPHITTKPSRFARWLGKI